MLWGILGYHTHLLWLLWSFSSIKPGCSGHTQVPKTRLMYTYFEVYSITCSYSGSKPSSKYQVVDMVIHALVPNLVVLVIRGYQT